MHHRVFRVWLLLFVAVWFGVVVPGHRRGQVLLPGTGKSCCSASTTHCGAPGHPDREPLSKRAACAICHFMAMLDLPAPVQLDVPSLGFGWPADRALLEQSCAAAVPLELRARPASCVKSPIPVFKIY